MLKVPQSTIKVIRFAMILGALMLGVLFLTWKDMSAKTPELVELKIVTANSFRTDVGRDSLLQGGRASIEFFDGQGHRFQTPRISDEELGRIMDALASNVPVQLRYGRWLSPFPSTKIFTVYQLEAGNSVIIPYERLARANQKEQDHKSLIISITVLVACGAMFIGAKRGLRIREMHPSKDPAPGQPADAGD